MAGTLLSTVVVVLLVVVVVVVVEVVVVAVGGGDQSDQVVVALALDGVAEDLPGGAEAAFLVAGGLDDRIGGAFRGFFVGAVVADVGELVLVRGADVVFGGVGGDPEELVVGGLGAHGRRSWR